MPLFIKTIIYLSIISAELSEPVILKDCQSINFWIKVIYRLFSSLNSIEPENWYEELKIWKIRHQNDERFLEILISTKEVNSFKVQVYIN